MRKITAIYMLFLLMTPTSSLHHTSELIELSKVLMTQDLEVDQWTVTVKEKLFNEQANEKLNMFGSNYKVELLDDEKALKYKVSNKERVDGFSVSFTIIIPKEEQYYAEMVMRVEGDELTKDHFNAYQQQIQFLQDQFFSRQAKVFTCLTTINNAIITSDVFLKETAKKLELKHVSNQFEEVKKGLYREIIYGYTTFLEDEVLLEDHPLNIQIVIQTDENQQQKIIIGTPILITEY